MKKTFYTLSDIHGDLSAELKTPADFLLLSGDVSPLNIQNKNTAMTDWLSGRFRFWLNSLPVKHVVFIAGNHDFVFENRRFSRNFLGPNIHYLQSDWASIDGVEFFGSPWTPWFYDWTFNFPRFDKTGGSPIAETEWAKIPDDTQVLLTHGPPSGILDKTVDGTGCGCPALCRRIRELNALKLHVFGHIHDSRGILENDVVLVNASWGYEHEVAKRKTKEIFPTTINF